jgi:hypothetical protein
MQRRVERGSVPVKTRDNDSRKVDRANSAQAETAGTSRTPSQAWVDNAEYRHRAKESRTSGERSKRERRCDGIARQARRDQRALKGRKPQERRPIDHGFLVKRRRCGVLTPKPCTRSDRRRRLGPQCPKGRSRAGASKRTPTRKTRHTTTHPRVCRCGKRVPPAAKANAAAWSPRTGLPRRPKRGRDEGPDR